VGSVRLFGGNLWVVGGDSVEGNQRLRSLWVGLGKYCGGESVVGKGEGWILWGNGGWESVRLWVCDGVEFARIFGFISRRGICSMGLLIK
jgi:hypothetical protein